MLLRRRVSLWVMLLVNYTRGSRVLLQVLGRRLTLLLVLRVMRLARTGWQESERR